MSSIVELLVIVIIGVTGFTLVYKILPYRVWPDKKPRLALFPKYFATYNRPVNEIESSLEKLQFKKISDREYTRGKIYGDFSAKVIKLSVKLDTQNNLIKVSSGFFGILFDTGDIWQVTSDILEG